jgi:hypothetical protein
MFHKIHPAALLVRLAIAVVVIAAVAISIQLVAPTLRAVGTVYYVDCAAGNDANNGTSTSTAWRTTTRANQQTYGAGDQILFKRGTVCSGAGFAPTGNGGVGNPVVIADYGSGALPQIDGVGEHEPAIMLRNVQNYTVRNLDLTQHGQGTCVLDSRHQIASCPGEMIAILHIEGRGPVGVQACGEACTVRNILAENLKVHDGQWNGIFISGGLYDLDFNTYGFVDNVVVTNVESWNNWKHGIEASCTYYKSVIYTTSNIQALDSYVHDNGGDGIVFGPVDHGLIDGNETPYNGKLIDARLGAWTWDSHDVVIQFNNSHHNMTPQNDGFARDGGGFDLDLGTEDGIMQYNWSHDNEGEGYLLMTWPIGYGYARGVTHNAQMRYNISERDAQKLSAAILVYGGVDPAVVFNNTIYFVAMRNNVPEMFGAYGAPLITSTWGKSGNPNLYTYNNIFITDGTVYPGMPSYNLMTNGRGNFYFDNNIWWRVEGGLQFDWNGTIINTWAGWQAMGFDLHGFNANPQFVGPLGGGPAAYQLTANSPAINAGRTVVEALRGMGTRDYFGNAIPQGGAYDIGAIEYTGAPPPPTNTPLPPTNTPVPPTNTPTRTPTPVPPTNTPGGPTNTPVPPTNTPTRTPTPVPPTATPTATPGGGGGSIFFDGFEDGDIVGWTASGSAWADPGAAYAGSYGAREKLDGSSMWRTVSTAGRTNIHLKYVGRGRDLDAGEYLLVEWYDGSTWTVIDNQINGPEWVIRDWTLPAGAANNPNFAIRFTEHADKNTEWVDFDNVEVTGQ